MNTFAAADARNTQFAAKVAETVIAVENKMKTAFAAYTAAMSTARANEADAIDAALLAFAGNEDGVIADATYRAAANAAESVFNAARDAARAAYSATIK